MTPEQRRRLSAAAVTAAVVGGLWALSTVVGIVTQILAIPYAAPSGLNEAFTATLAAGVAIYHQQHKARLEAAARDAERERQDRARPAPPQPSPTPTPQPAPAETEDASDD